jgi:porin
VTPPLDWNLARTFRGLAFVCAMVAGGSARADNPPPAPSGAEQQQGEGASDDASKNLLGDMGGLRSAIAPYGFDFKASETSEILGNVSGGLRRGAIYEGLTDVSLKWDLRKYFHWRGVFYLRAFQIHGRGLSGDNLGNLNTASSIEADPSTRLFEAWYEQHIGDWLRLRVGQQAADQEFLVSNAAKLFVNATFGFPTLAGTNLPSGGPAYPLATPAVRVRIDASDALTFFAGVFNGNPTGAALGDPDPQRLDPSGTAFRTNDGVLALFETRYNPENSDKNGTYKIGAWFNSERFLDQRFATNGVSLASPLSSGTPRMLGNNYSIYGIVDQPLGDTGLTAFVRAMGAPGDRNLVNFYVDAGLVYNKPFGRDGDQVGIGYGYARIGDAARALDIDTAKFGGTPYPTRSQETVLEITYQYAVDGLPWLQLQPDFQYVSNPGGGIPNPAAPNRKIGDAAIFGLRAAITF